MTCVSLKAQVLSEEDKPVPHNDILEEELESEEIDEETGQIAAVGRYQHQGMPLMYLQSTSLERVLKLVMFPYFSYVKKCETYTH